MSRRVRKGDLVAVMTGDDRGKRGRVLRVLRDEDRVVVEGVNLVYKHMRKSQKNPQGGRIRREAPIHASNVLPVDPETNHGTRVRMRSEDGLRVRVGARSGAALDAAAARRGAGKHAAEDPGTTPAEARGEEK